MVLLAAGCLARREGLSRWADMQRIFFLLSEEATLLQFRTRHSRLENHRIAELGARSLCV